MFFEPGRAMRLFNASKAARFPVLLQEQQLQNVPLIQKSIDKIWVSCFKYCSPAARSDH
jgi:hypothetical protein